jgi:hypothetical protein
MTSSAQESLLFESKMMTGLVFGFLALFLLLVVVEEEEKEEEMGGGVMVDLL